MHLLPCRYPKGAFCRNVHAMFICLYAFALVDHWSTTSTQLNTCMTSLFNLHSITSMGITPRADRTIGPFCWWVFEGACSEYYVHAHRVDTTFKLQEATPENSAQCTSLVNRQTQNLVSTQLLISVYPFLVCAKYNPKTIAHTRASIWLGTHSFTATHVGQISTHQSTLKCS